MAWKTCAVKEQRVLFVKAWLAGKTTVAQLCQPYEISRKTAYKWWQRYREKGLLGLTDQAPVPRRVPNRPSALWLQRLCGLRKKRPTWGAAKLQVALRERYGKPGLPSPAAIKRWLKAWGLNQKRRRPAHQGVVMERPKLTMPKRPNDVWTVDFKGWFRTGDGLRVEPLTVKDLASRYALGIAYQTDQSVAQTRPHFVRLFRRHGLPKAIRSDNGAPFGATGAQGLTRLSAWWIKLGIQVQFIAPGRPQQNGSHEQFHRLFKAEVLKPLPHTLKALKKRTQAWLKDYNQRRPHQALGQRQPAKIYRQSHRKMPRQLKAWRYPKAWSRHWVKGNGTISLAGQSRFIGEAFVREYIGLKPARKSVWKVYFGSLYLGDLAKQGLGGMRARWYQKRRHQKLKKSSVHSPKVSPKR